MDNSKAPSYNCWVHIDPCNAYWILPPKIPWPLTLQKLTSHNTILPPKSKFSDPPNRFSSKISNLLPLANLVAGCILCQMHDKFWIRHCTCTVIFKLLSRLTVPWISIIWYIPREIETSKSVNCDHKKVKQLFLHILVSDKCVYHLFFGNWLLVTWMSQSKRRNSLLLLFINTQRVHQYFDKTEQILNKFFIGFTFFVLLLLSSGCK